ncbi:MAG: hypothetical protein ACREXS_06560 [Gammaproteobacteria bacterium]
MVADPENEAFVSSASAFEIATKYRLGKLSVAAAFVDGLDEHLRRVEETPEGVLLRPLKPFAQTRVEEVFGMARYQGPIRSLKDMAEAVLDEARKRK